MRKLILPLILALFTSTAHAQYTDANGREWMRIDKTFSFAGSLLVLCDPDCSGIVTQYDYSQTTNTFSNPRQISLNGYVLASREETQTLMDSVGLFTLGYSGWIAPTYSYDAWVYALTSSKDAGGAPYIAYAQEGHNMVSFYFNQGFTTGATQGPVGGLLHRASGQPKNCVNNDAELLHGDSFTAYKAATVAYNQTCQSEIRTCTNGVLSGTFTAPSCTVTPPLDCSYNGQPVLHGQQVTGYSSSTASNLKTWGTFCPNLGVTRTCTNGSLGGSVYPTCLQTTYNPDRCEVKAGALKCKSGKPIVLSTKLYN